MKSLKYEGVVKLKIFWSLKRLEAGLNGFRIKRVHYGKFGLQIIREPPYFSKPNTPYLPQYKKAADTPPFHRSPFRFRPLPLSSPSAVQSGTYSGRRPSPAANPSTLPFCFIILQTHVLFSIFPYGLLRSPSSLWLSGDLRRSLRVDNQSVSSYLCFLVWLLGSSSFTMFLTLFHVYFVCLHCPSSFSGEPPMFDDDKLHRSFQVS